MHFLCAETGREGKLSNISAKKEEMRRAASDYVLSWHAKTTMQRPPWECSLQYNGSLQYMAPP